MYVQSLIPTRLCTFVYFRKCKICPCCEFREEGVHVLGFEVSEEELKDGLKGSATQR